jgi:nitrite reductase/ring-hydroxylating ferredoxin subunit
MAAISSGERGPIKKEKPESHEEEVVSGMSFVDVASVDDIPAGTVRHVEAGGIEIALANVKGTLYAVGDRCGHQNAPLSKGTLYENIITCPLHHAQFDVKTGKMISGMVELSLPGMDRAPQEVQDAMKAIGELTTHIKTHDLPSFPVKVEGKRVYVKV